MDTKQHALPLALVGLLGVLTVGAIVLSLSTAPAVDQENLRIAAKATMVASSFTLTDTNAVTPLAGGNTRREVVHVQYQAPDRVRESGIGPTGQAVAVIVIGSTHYRTSGSKWVVLAPSTGLGAQAVTTVLSPLVAAADAARTTRTGDVYDFVPTNLARYIGTVLGMTPSQLSSLRLTATVHGDFVTEERIDAVYRGQQLSVDLALSQIGSTPPIEAPPASQLVPAG